MSNQVELAVAGPSVPPMSTKTTVPTPLLTDYISIAMLAIVCVVGGSLNLLVLVKLCTQYRRLTKQLHQYDMKTAFLILKIQVTVANLLICLLDSTWRLGWLISYSWLGGDALCRVFNFLSMFTLNFASYSILCVAIDRALIVNALLGSETSVRMSDLSQTAMTRVKYYLVVAPLFSLIFSISQLFTWQVFQPPLETPIAWEQCVSVFEVAFHTHQPVPFPVGKDTYNVLHLIGSFWLPFLLMIICYSYISVVLCGYAMRPMGALQRDSMPMASFSINHYGTSAVQQSTSLGALPFAAHKRSEHVATVVHATPLRASSSHTELPAVVVTTSCVASPANQLSPSPSAHFNHQRRRLPSRVPAWRTQMRCKMFRTSALVIGFYIVCFTPYNLITLLQLGHPQRLSFFNFDRPSLRSLSDNVTGLIINGEMMLDFPRPFPLTVWYLGKMQSAKEEQLPKHPEEAQANQQWLQICDEISSKGTIVFSFGTAVEPKLMPNNWRPGILKSLSHFTDYQIIWRFDDPLPNEAKVPSHVTVVNWMPQKEILNHLRTKLFITHGGYNSLLESTTAGVPMVMVPLVDMDQHINAQKALRREIAVVVDKMTLKDSDALIEAMQQVLSNQSFTNNVRKLRSLYDDLPVESYILNDFNLRRIQKSHFRRIYNQQTLRNLSFIQYYCIDIVGFWLVLICSKIYILTKLILKIL